MTDLINILTSQEIIIVYIVVGVACFLYFIIYLIDKSYYKRKQKQNTKELNRLVEDINIELEKEEPDVLELVENTEAISYIEPVLNEVPVEDAIIKEDAIKEVEKVEEVQKIEPVIEEKNIVENTKIEKEEQVEDLVLDTMESIPSEEITYTAIEPNPKEAQEELRRLTEELEKAEEEPKNIDLTSYEEAQERDAIISLDELIRKSKEMYESNEITQYEDEGNEPISLADLERRIKENSVVEEITPNEVYEEPILEPITVEALEEETSPTQMVLDDFVNVKTEPVKRPVYQENIKYKPSPIISPIFGIEKTQSQSDIELENTATYEKLDEEIKKTNEFLMTLKELQKHLE